ncbi:MAG: NUDIX hydrolase [Candidatus Cyclobacteriaceae bacterium M2_1C_046]
MSSFSDAVEKLRKRLTAPLPGDEARQLMMPIGRASEQQRLMEEEKEKLRLGGVLILLFQQEGQIKFPLTLRHTYPGIHSGQVSLPGGRKEEQDNDLIMTALRETEEEIGVSISDINVIGTLSELYIPPSRYKILPTVAYIEKDPTFEIDPREVKELFLADLQHLTDIKFRKKKEILVRGQYRLNTPYFDIQDKVVWGATAMILSEFSKIVEEVDQMP